MIILYQTAVKQAEDQWTEMQHLWSHCPGSFYTAILSSLWFMKCWRWSCVIFHSWGNFGMLRQSAWIWHQSVPNKTGNTTSNHLRAVVLMLRDRHYEWRFPASGNGNVSLVRFETSGCKQDSTLIYIPAAFLTKVPHTSSTAINSWPGPSCCLIKFPSLLQSDFSNLIKHLMSILHEHIQLLRGL